MDSMLVVATFICLLFYFSLDRIMCLLPQIVIRDLPLRSYLLAFIWELIVFAIHFQAWIQSDATPITFLHLPWSDEKTRFTFLILLSNFIAKMVADAVLYELNTLFQMHHLGVIVLCLLVYFIPYSIGGNATVLIMAECGSMFCNLRDVFGGLWLTRINFVAMIATSFAGYGIAIYANCCGEESNALITLTLLISGACFGFFRVKDSYDNLFRDPISSVKTE